MFETNKSVIMLLHDIAMPNLLAWLNFYPHRGEYLQLSITIHFARAKT